ALRIGAALRFGAGGAVRLAGALAAEGTGIGVAFGVAGAAAIGRAAGIDGGVALPVAGGDEAQWGALGLAAAFELEMALTEGQGFEVATCGRAAGLRESGRSEREEGERAGRRETRCTKRHEGSPLKVTKQ